MTLERTKKAKANANTTAMVASSQPLDIPKKDEPINSRNSPSSLNVLSTSLETEDFSTW